VKIPIPDDWGGEYSCIEIQWPDSTLWRAILLGLIDQMAAGRLWDERTGSIKDVQEVGRAIWRANVDLKSCAGESLPPPTPEQIFVYSGADSEDDCEMGCAPCIRWNNGILEVFSCGEWGPVPGNTGEAPTDSPGVDPGDPAQDLPGDDDTVDIDVKCRFASALARAMWRVHERVVDYIDDVITIPVIGEKVASDLPEYTLGKYHISQAVVELLLAVGLLDLDLVFGDEATHNADMAAYIAKFMPTRYTLNTAQWEALCAAMVFYSFNDGVQINLGQFVEGDYWQQILRAIGQGTANDLGAASRTMPASEFDCEERPIYITPPPTPPTDGGPWWSGLVTKSDGEGAIAVTSLTNNMRKAALRWMVDAPGEQYTNLVANLQMVAPTNITSLRVHLTGDYPVEDWRQTGNVWDYPHQPTLTGVTGVSQNLVSADSTKAVIDITFSSGKPTGYEGGSSSEFRMLPGDTRSAGKTTTFEIEIISWA